eukprot:TRINITY_DN13441_c0_g1_i7.p1 TRINITY_DN13441_c0_g1~~TRINITY_DN13441_c0_g1_i7.p1  ORF type:complete len:344 (-),score=47.91 TRINITY_DN13441_c0_g1_i7:55-1047(-)
MEEKVATRVAKGVGLSFVMVLMVGTLFGLPSLHPLMLREKMFMSFCTPDMNLTECEKLSEEDVSRGMSVAFSIFVCSALFMGVAASYAGTRMTLLCSTLIWIVSTSIMGVGPEEGWIFFLCVTVSSVSVLGIFLAALGDLAFEISPKSFPALMGGLLTGMWDLGSLTYMLIGMIRNVYTDSPLWIFFFSYSMIVGIPALAFFHYFWPVCSEKPEERGEAGLWATMDSFKMILSNIIFWSLTLCCMVTATYCSFFFPMIVDHMKWHGADETQADYYLSVWSFLLPFVGFPATLIVAFGVDYSKPRNLVIISLIQVSSLIWARLIGHEGEST